MNDIKKLFNARKTLLTMFSDRGCTVPESAHVKTVDDMKKLFYTTQLDFNLNTEKYHIYVKWIMTQKIKPNVVKDIIETLKTTHGEDNPKEQKIILVLKAKPNTNLLKIVKEKEYKVAEIFWLNDITFNRSTHILVPKYIKLTEEEIKDVMDQYYVKNRTSFPLMQKDDAMAKYLDLASGDVCKIIRPGPFGDISFRAVK